MRKLFTITLALGALAAARPALAQDCVKCHQKETPSIVTDWKLSRHSKQKVGCEDCHGTAHKTAADAAAAEMPLAATCGGCHEERLKQYSAGKHALAWAAMKAMPTIHYQPMALTDGLKGCGGCHRLGIKSEADVKEFQKAGRFGATGCNACHTRHTFSLAEARSPEACKTCHMGFDHPQWEMYDSSKHGVRYQLVSKKALPPTAAAPTCQTCHMPKGDHEVRTAWGFLAVRLPMPEDKQWADDRATILMALGVLDPTGKPTGRLDVVKGADVARLTAEAWQKERDKMVGACGSCHSTNFAKAELAKGDALIKDADHLMAEAIRVVAGLYKDGLLKKAKGYASAYPDLLTFYDAPTEIEQRLFVMFLEHRMRTFQGVFHQSPDYALWYGWNEMVMDLTSIREMAEGIRAKAGRRTK